jgi:hypothetical protein
LKFLKIFFELFQAAILQQTAEYIYQLEQEKTSLLSQNCQLKRLINQQEGQHETTSSKKRKIDTGSDYWSLDHLYASTSGVSVNAVDEISGLRNV